MSVTNLNRVRKARAKADRKAAADVNVVRHGTPKALRAAQTMAAERDARALDGHRRDDTHGG